MVEGLCVRFSEEVAQIFLKGEVDCLKVVLKALQTVPPSLIQCYLHLRISSLVFQVKSKPKVIVRKNAKIKPESYCYTKDFSAYNLILVLMTTTLSLFTRMCV